MSSFHPEARCLLNVRDLDPSTALVKSLGIIPYKHAGDHRPHPQLQTAPHACLHLAPAATSPERWGSLGGREPQCSTPKT